MKKIEKNLNKIHDLITKQFLQQLAEGQVADAALLKAAMAWLKDNGSIAVDPEKNAKIQALEESLETRIEDLPFPTRDLAN